MPLLANRDARWLWNEVRPFLPHQSGALLCIVIASLSGLAAPLLMKLLVDEVFPNRDWTALAIVTGLFLASMVVRSSLTSLSSLINTLAIQRMSFRIRSRLVRCVQSRPPDFHNKHPAGDLIQRLERDITLVGELGLDLFPGLVRMVFSVPMTVAVMVYLDWRVSAVIVPLLPLFAYVRYKLGPPLKRGAEAVREANARQSSLLNEMLAGVIQVQLLGAEQRLARRYRRLDLRTMRQQILLRKRELLFLLLSGNIIGLGMALVIGYGGVRVLTGSLTAGVLVAFYGYIERIFQPMTEAVELYARVNRVRASVRRLVDIEHAPGALIEAAGAMPAPAAPVELSCTNASFGYTPENPALRNVSFSARAGERLAVVGPSGCGKTSLLKLIARLHEPQTGQIRLDGLDVRALQLRTLRGAISFVPQEPVLFQGTLRDNLRLAGRTVSAQDIAHAAWISCFSDVVEQMPRRWDTELGPMGSGLSGGEKQRMAITRAILQQRPILILDEATSGLDGPTEQQLFSRLRTWSADRIVIVVSHRLAVPRWADRVIVMQAGQVIEDSTHHVLARPGTHYADLWQLHQTVTDEPWTSR
jgi:ABC-type multidrug transport system fused ATPase/permease subunit